MTEEIIFSDTTKNIELYSDGTTNISREKYSALEQENKELKKKLELDEVQLESYFIGEEKICKENEKYRKALEEIKELNKHCADCEGNACGVCAAADGKPNNSYRIANEALK